MFFAGTDDPAVQSERHEQLMSIRAATRTNRFYETGSLEGGFWHQREIDLN